MMRACVHLGREDGLLGSLSDPELILELPRIQGLSTLSFLASDRPHGFIADSSYISVSSLDSPLKFRFMCVYQTACNTCCVSHTHLHTCPELS